MKAMSPEDKGSWGPVEDLGFPVLPSVPNSLHWPALSWWEPALSSRHRPPHIPVTCMHSSCPSMHPHPHLPPACTVAAQAPAPTCHSLRWEQPRPDAQPASHLHLKYNQPILAPKSAGKAHQCVVHTHLLCVSITDTHSPHSCTLSRVTLTHNLYTFRHTCTHTHPSHIHIH